MNVTYKSLKANYVFWTPPTGEDVTIRLLPPLIETYMEWSTRILEESINKRYDDAMKLVDKK